MKVGLGSIPGMLRLTTSADTAGIALIHHVPDDDNWDLCTARDGHHRHRQWTAHLIQDDVEHRPGAPRQIEHERPEFAVEVGEEQQRPVAQQSEARTVEFESLQHLDWRT